jgi:hypothetical protein
MITLARPGDPNLFEDVDSALGDIVGAGLRVLAQDVFDLMPDLADRIKRGPRVLKDHRHFAALHFVQDVRQEARAASHIAWNKHIDPRLRCTRSAL